MRGVLSLIGEFVPRVPHMPTEARNLASWLCWRRGFGCWARRTRMIFRCGKGVQRVLITILMPIQGGAARRERCQGDGWPLLRIVAGRSVACWLFLSDSTKPHAH